MTAPTYRVGQAAKLLNVSSHHIRRLCESGLVQGDVSAGGQWRLPLDEVERLKRSGVPPVPSVDAPQEQTPKALPQHPNRQAVAAEPSTDVLDERAQVEIATAQLQRRKIELERAEVDDAFVERDEKRRQADLQRRREELALRDAAARLQQERFNTAAREAFLKRWREHAHKRVPSECTADTRLQVNAAVEHALAQTTHQHPERAVKELIDAAVDAALEPHYRATARRKTVDHVLWHVMWNLPGDYDSWLRKHDEEGEIRATVLTALTALPDNATEKQMRTAAVGVIQPRLDAFQQAQTIQKHGLLKQRLLDSLRSWRWLGNDGATNEERTRATEAVRKALDACAPGTPESEMEKAKVQALAPFDRLIEERAKAERRHHEAERFADRALRHVDTYLSQQFEYDTYHDQADDEKQWAAVLRPMLITRFLEGKYREPEEAHAFIARYIDRHSADVEDQ